MDRLTYAYSFAGNRCWQVHGADSKTCAETCSDQGCLGCDGCPIRKVIYRLAAYENTGLLPEEIVAYLTPGVRLDTIVNGQWVRTADSEKKEDA